eukprot:COSAG03_NODE_3651_length_1898_cov_3.848805_3_plen_110_part_00
MSYVVVGIGGRRCDSYYKQYLYSALNASKITEADIDTAVSRILTHFIALGGWELIPVPAVSLLRSRPQSLRIFASRTGELDGPDDVIYQTYGPEMVDTTEHRLLSLSVA